MSVLLWVVPDVAVSKGRGLLDVSDQMVFVGGEIYWSDLDRVGFNRLE